MPAGETLARKGARIRNGRLSPAGLSLYRHIDPLGKWHGGLPYYYWRGCEGGVTAIAGV
jgi:hypothetical protein